MQHGSKKLAEIRGLPVGTHLVRQVVTMRRGTAGYSLIEILVVVALVAVLAGMVAPAVTAAMDRYELISASQQVVSTIRAARIQAVARNSRVRTRVVQVAPPAPDEYQNELWDGAAWVALSGVNELADDLSFGGSVNIQFETNGRMIGAPVSITVSNGDAAQDRTISVSTSGQVQLQQ
jgi:prepilin-type N-terminal cleavage/methylation domain-containing protein